MPNSILDAIKLGLWDFEPREMDQQQYRATRALPGTREKIDVLADRARQGLPLWHPSDCADFEQLAGFAQLEGFDLFGLDECESDFD